MPYAETHGECNLNFHFIFEKINLPPAPFPAFVGCCVSLTGTGVAKRFNHSEASIFPAGVAGL